MSRASSARHDRLDALAAGFPAGTVSGAPKVRAMQIIDELEKDKRSLYAGSVGYFSAGDAMDTCIVLRTALIKDGTMYVQAGAGIVADSDPSSSSRNASTRPRLCSAPPRKPNASPARRGGAAVNPPDHFISRAETKHAVFNVSGVSAGFRNRP